MQGLESGFDSRSVFYVFEVERREDIEGIEGEVGWRACTSKVNV